MAKKKNKWKTPGIIVLIVIAIIVLSQTFSLISSTQKTDFIFEDTQYIDGKIMLANQEKEVVHESPSWYDIRDTLNKPLEPKSARDGDWLIATINSQTNLIKFCEVFKGTPVSSVISTNKAQLRSLIFYQGDRSWYNNYDNTNLYNYFESITCSERILDKYKTFGHVMPVNGTKLPQDYNFFFLDYQAEDKIGKVQGYLLVNGQTIRFDEEHKVYYEAKANDTVSYVITLQGTEDITPILYPDVKLEGALIIGSNQEINISSSNTNINFDNVIESKEPKNQYGDITINGEKVEDIPEEKVDNSLLALEDQDSNTAYIWFGGVILGIIGLAYWKSKSIKKKRRK